MSPYQTAGVAYQAQAVETAGPGQLVVMLYDGAIAAIARAEHSMESTDRNKIEVINHELTRAQDIVTELMLSLDHDQGGSIASNLAAIYEYCLSNLTQANLEKSPRNLPHVKAQLGRLRDAFADASAQVAAAGAA